MTSNPGTTDHRRILLLVTDLQIGGTPTVVRELAIRLNNTPRVRVDVACLAGHGPVVDQLEAAGIKVTALGARRATDLAIIPRLYGLISANLYDTVFSFLVHANTAAAMLAPFCKGVRFLQSIQTTQPNPSWHWHVQSLVQHAADAIVVPSRSVAEAAEKWAEVPREKIAVIPNAIEMAEFPQVSVEFDTQNPITIGFIGRLDPIKRIPDLLHAMALLPDRVHLNIFGEGHERPHIETLVRELNLHERVKLRGSIARPQDAFAGMSLLVLPSAAEGFGLVLIEAMASGIPVVATNVPGIRDVVRDRETGLLAPPNSPADLARAIDRVLRDQRLRERLVSQAREDVVKRFTWDVVLSQYEALIGLQRD